MQEHCCRHLPDDATPLDLLMSVYRNPELPIALRIHAAGKGCSVRSPALKSVEQSGEGGGPQRIEIGWEKPS